MEQVGPVVLVPGKEKPPLYLIAAPIYYTRHRSGW